MVCSTHRRRGFTLVELLVVIGIIALLISILLPALGKARNSANTAACLANMRSIGQAMTMYATQNKGCIPGSSWTSGRQFWTNATGTVLAASNAAGPYTTTNIDSGGPIQTYDWVSPLARVMGLRQPDTTDGNVVYQWYQTLPQFTCPSARGLTSFPYAPSTVPAGQILSYNTAAAFLLIPVTSGHTGGGGVTIASGGSSYWTLPSGYFPKVTKVGSPAQKIYAFDGAKYSTSYDPAAPSIEYSTTSGCISNHQFNDFADYGAFFGNSKSVDRSGARNKYTGSTMAGSSTVLRDGRIFGFRHGSQQGGGYGGSMRGNAVFYDGHAETMDDLTMANPALWLPRGSVMANPSATVASGRSTFWPDAIQAYNIGANYTAP